MRTIGSRPRAGHVSSRGLFSSPHQFWLYLLALPLMLVVLTTVGIHAAGAQASASESATVFDEDFEQYPLSSYPTSFSQLSSQENYSGSITEVDSGDKSFRLAKTAPATVSSYATRAFDPDPDQGRVTLRVRALAEQTDLTSFVALLRGESNVITQIAFFDDGKIKAFTDAGWTEIAPYAPDTWYDLRITLDVETHTFDVLVDDQQLASGWSFRTAQSELRQWQVGLFSGASTGALVLDDLEVIKNEPLEPSGFHEDFESLPLGAYPSTFDPETVSADYSAVTHSIEEEPGRFLQISRIGMSAESYYANKTLDSPLSDTRISFRASAQQTDGIAYASVIRGATGAIAQIAFLQNGTIGVFQNGWVSLLDGYEPDRWYSVDIVVDSPAQTFAVFVDGQLLDDDLVFQTPQSQVTRIGFGLYQGTTSASLRVDDLEVAPYEETPIENVELEGGPLSLAQASEARLELSVTPREALLYEATWSSDDEDIATVDSRGVVRGIHPGEATVEVRVTDSLNGTVHTAGVPVTVYFQSATGLSVVPQSVTLPVGGSETLVAELEPSDASDKSVAWSSSNESLVEVGSDGTVAARAPGEAQVTATTNDGGLTATAHISVEPRAVAYTWYVDPTDGDDTAAGTLEAPFETLTAARDAFRTATSNGTLMSGDAEIVLRGGIHELQTTLLLDERDTSSTYYTVSYRAFPGEEPVLSGGQRVTGWELHDPENSIYRAPANGIETRQLYVDGLRATRARSEGPLEDASLTPDGVRSGDTDMSTWDALDEIEFVFQERWTQPRALVQSAALSTDGTAIEFALQQPGWTAINSKGQTSVTEGPVYIENAYELLDVEGEWYSDDDYHYYKPRPFEDMSEALVTAPVLEQLIRAEGSSLDARIKNLAFEGLSFSHTTWMFPSTGAGLSDAQNNHLRYPGQDDVLIEAAVTVRKAHNVSFTRNTFRHLGSTGLKIIDGVQDSVVSENRFYDISGSALNVGEPTVRDPDIYAPSDPRLVMRNVDVTSNYIHDIGIDYASAAAISAGFPVDMEISHNQIFNVPYSGIHVGYGWYNFVSTGQRDVRIQDNYIHDILGTGLYDGGAIYTVGYTGASPEEMNLVSGNYLQNQLDRWSLLYADNASDFWEFSRNVIDQTETPTWGTQPAYWAFGKQEELRFDYNYTTTPAVNTSFGAPLNITNTHVHPEADWPAEALSIIANAGLAPTDHDRLAREVERVLVTPELNMDAGETAQIASSATTNKGEIASLDGVRVSHRTLNPEIATVTPAGVVRAEADGIAAIETSLVFDDLVWRYTTEVYVGDEILSIELRNAADDGQKMILGETFDLGVFGATSLGREVPLPEASIQSSDPDYVEVQPDGSLLGVAEGEVAITVSLAGSDLSPKTIPLEVITFGSDEGLQIPPYVLDAEFDDLPGWKVSSGSLSAVEEGIRFTTPSGQGYYDSQTYQDELLTFDMTIEAEAGYEVIQIRNQTLSAPLKDTYAIVIKPDEIELQRFNNGERTVIFGMVDGFASVGGPGYQNDVLPFGERRQIQVGAIEEADGVRIVLNVGGENIFYYLDKDADRISEPGYLSVMARYGSVLISPATIAPPEGLLPPAQAALSTTSGWITGLHDGNYEVHMNLWWGSNAEEFRLYENDVLHSTIPLRPDGDSSQHAVVTITDRPNGEYRYTGELINAAGSTAAVPVVVTVGDAHPGLPTLSVTSGTGAERTLRTDMWWGTNATTYRLFRNGVLIDEQTLDTATPHPQHAETLVSGLAPGVHEFQSELANHAGETRSEKLALMIGP